MKKRFLLALAFVIASAAVASISFSEYAVGRSVERLIIERAKDRLSLIAWGFAATSTDVDVYATVDFDEEVLAVRKGKSLIFQYGTARLDLGSPNTRHIEQKSGSYDFTLYIDLLAATSKYLDPVRTTIKITTIVFALLFGIFGWALVSMAVDPITRLASSMVAITSRNLQVRVPVPRRKDEMRQLILTFNSMLDEIETAYRKQAQFVEDMTHDIVTPVQILEGFRQLIERHGRKEALVDEFLEVSKTELARLRDMTVELKALTAAAKLRSVEAQDASGMTERIVKYYRELFPDISFEASIDPGVVLRIASADLERMENILIDNAVKYGGSGGIVEIRLTKGEFSVRDRGPGIEPEEREAIFERYRRGRNAAGKGTGLGLAILKKFSEEYGFDILVESAPGGGAVFRLVFPSR